MRRAVPLTALLAALAAAPAAADLPTFKAGTRIDPGRSVAGVRIGASLESAAKAWGPGQCAEAGELTTCAYVGPGVPSELGQASFTLRGGKVASISVNAGYDPDNTRVRVVKGPLARLKTRKGIGLGSKSAAVKRAYPKARKPYPNRWQIIGPGARKTTFTIVKGKVSDIQIEAG